MLTRKEAEAAVLATLEARHCLEPVNYNDLILFAIEMNRIIEFPTEGDPLSEIEEWAEDWLRSKQPPSPTVEKDRAPRR